MLGMILTLALFLSGIGSVGSSELDGSPRGSCTVWGYVYDNVTGEALPDIEVRLYNYDTDHEYQDYSDENGFFEFDNLEAGDYSLRFYDEKYYYFRDYLSLEGNDNRQYDAYLDPYECTVYGNIYAEDTGEPIEYPYIYLDGYSDEGDRYYLYDNPGEDAYYDFFIPPGEYELKAYGEGYSRGDENVEVDDGDELQIDFYLTPLCSISGIVYDVETLEPLNDIEVVLYEKDEPYWVTYDWSNETGYYALYMESGAYDIRIRNERGYEDFEESFDILEGDKVEYDIHLEPDLTRLSGYVYNLTSGEPIEDALVYCYNYDTYDRDHTYTDENGYYESFPGAGETSITVNKDGYKDYYDSIVMEEDVHQERDYYLDPYTSMLFGIVYDEDTSEPIYDAYITVQGEDIYETTWSDSEGKYHLYLDGGEYSIKASYYDYVTFETTVVIQDWEDYELDIYLVPFNCMVFGYVTNGDGEFIEGAYASISSDSYNDYIYTDEDGYYEFECPPSSESGEYRLYVSADGYRPYQENFWLEAGEDLQVDVELQEQWSAGSIWRWIWEQIFGN